MENNEKTADKKVFGLIGKNISYSFSGTYFKEKFKTLSLSSYQYTNFDIVQIEEFPNIIKKISNMGGLNVTIPYKQTIIKYLDELDITAKQIGAVNTIKQTKSGILKGYNTDAFGFQQSFVPLLSKTHKNALILGTGGASKAIAYVLEKLKINFLQVSRNPINKQTIAYKNIDEMLLKKYQIIINCTPLGTFPDTEKCPKIPYQFLTPNHLLYDLIYNPAVSTFLQKGKEQGATIKNGLEMLQLQAEKSWQIWNE